MIGGCGFRFRGVFSTEGSGFRVQDSGFRAQGSGFRFQTSGFRVQGSGRRVQGAGFRVQGAGCRYQAPLHRKLSLELLDLPLSARGTPHLGLEFGV